jgi:triphosphoribosyl-dephospho-CoA synthase
LIGKEVLLLITKMVPENVVARKTIDFIRSCGELACLLEVAASPKPGNVHRFRDFADIRFEHFLAAAVSLGYYIEKAAYKGYQIDKGTINWSDLHLGKIIKEAIFESGKFHNKGNTNLGIILLLLPMSVAAGMASSHNTGKITINLLQEKVEKIMQKTTIDDAIAISEAIAELSPGGLGKIERYDVTSDTYREELETDGITLLELMISCKNRDNICLELVDGYPITFNVGFPALTESYINSSSINLAVLHTFLTILANYPDSLILRKFGKAKANELSKRAAKIMTIGGVGTVEGQRELEEFDIELQEETEKINPGTTADLVASSLFIYLLLGGKI